MLKNLLQNVYQIKEILLRVGITGVPGVGKSSFIEVLGKLLTKKGHKVWFQ